MVLGPSKYELHCACQSNVLAACPMKTEEGSKDSQVFSQLFAVELSGIKAKPTTGAQSKISVYLYISGVFRILHLLPASDNQPSSYVYCILFLMALRKINETLCSQERQICHEQKRISKPCSKFRFCISDRYKLGNQEVFIS